MNTYEKKAEPGEVSLYSEVLNQIADTYNAKFSTLILPKALSIDADRDVIILPHYEGKTFNERWNESNGGSPLGLELSTEIPHMLYELSLIDATVVTQNSQLRKIPNLVFDHAKYLNGLDSKFKKFLEGSLLDKNDMAKAAEILQQPYSSSPIFNNGDFYPRNFIYTPEHKIVLVDWEPWNMHSPFYIIDYPENVAAVCFVHMWNNRLWQEKYAITLKKYFPMENNDFQKGILIKSLELADFWFGNDGRNDLCKNQLALFQSTLAGNIKDVL
jgi:hypothetical protein